MRTRVLVAALLTSILSLSISGDDSEFRTFGDPSIRTVIDALAHAVYDTANKPDAKRVLIIIRDNPLSIADAPGAEATGVFVEGIVGRIVASVWTKHGKY